MILPLVLYGCDTWSLKLREEHRLKVFENRVLKKMFGRKMDEVTGRRLHKGQLYILNSSPNIIWLIKSRRMVYAVYVACMGDIRIAYRVLGGNPEGDYME
jgi:hypothetical protein